jgi:hypothetical protein
VTAIENAGLRAVEIQAGMGAVSDAQRLVEHTVPNFGRLNMLVKDSPARKKNGRGAEALRPNVFL